MLTFLLGCALGFSLFQIITGPDRWFWSLIFIGFLALTIWSLT